MTAGSPLILAKTGAHRFGLRAIALALRGPPLQQEPRQFCNNLHKKREMKLCRRIITKRDPSGAASKK